MLILTVKLQDVEHKLKYPIEIIEKESWSMGRHMYILNIHDFRLLAIHDNLDVARMSICRSLNLMIDSYLFEPYYVFPDVVKSVALQNKIKRHIYG